MFALLQDWTEIEGFQLADVAQSGTGWLALDDFQDVTFYLEVRLKQNAELGLVYETAPSFDPTVFKSMLVSPIVMSASTTPIVTPILLSQNPLVPLAGLVRWRIVPVTASADWRVNFRISCLAKRSR